MRSRRPARALVTAVATIAALFAGAPAASATGGSSSPGDRSLAEVLAADGSGGFDRRWWDYDILEAAVLAVLAEKPDSAVGVLADGEVALTAFLPRDQAFRQLAKDLTGDWVKKERDVFEALVAAAGVETIEAVLLYHVVPGATIDYRTAKKSDGAVLDTALADASVTVDVQTWKRWKRARWCRVVTLVDNDPDARNAAVVRPNINNGNLQIAHGVSRVMRPIDL